MTERHAPLTAQCLSCGAGFQPRKAGHIFCSSVCRHRGERQLGKRALGDPEQLTRLFDDARDPDAQVRDDDWHPAPLSEFVELDAGDTVAVRRRWYQGLLREGLV